MAQGYVLAIVQFAPPGNVGWEIGRERSFQFVTSCRWVKFSSSRKFICVDIIVKVVVPVTGCVFRLDRLYSHLSFLVTQETCSEASQVFAPYVHAAETPATSVSLNMAISPKLSTIP